MKDYKWMEVSNNKIHWDRRAAVELFNDGGCRVVDSADNENHDNFKRFISNERYYTCTYNYRREIKEPKYVPFETIEKAKILKDKWVNAGDDEYRVNGFESNCVLVGNEYYDLEDIFKNFSIDGHPCGKLKE